MYKYARVVPRWLFTAAFLSAPFLAARAQARDSLAQEDAARALLRALEGRWQQRTPPSDSSRPRLRRSYRSTGDPLRLTWEELAAERPSAHGVLWYRPATRRFYYFAVHSPEQSALLLVGQLDSTGLSVRFDVPALATQEIPLNVGIAPSVLRLPSLHVHTWERYDRGWILTFDRLPGR